MTTIAYKDGIIAADSRVMSNGWIAHDLAPKVFLRKNVFFAVSGDAVDGKAAIEAILKGEKYIPQDPQTSFTVMAVNMCGDIKVWCNGETHTEGELIPLKYWAIGSGRIAAMAAMEVGADAVWAVDIAKKYDPNTGGDVKAYAIDDLIKGVL